MSKKITVDQAIEILRLNNLKVPKAEVARQFKIARSTLYYLLKHPQNYVKYPIDNTTKV